MTPATVSAVSPGSSSGGTTSSSSSSGGSDTSNYFEFDMVIRVSTGTFGFDIFITADASGNISCPSYGPLIALTCTGSINSAGHLSLTTCYEAGDSETLVGTVTRGPSASGSGTVTFTDGSSGTWTGFAPL